jgi:gliding motility-associated-like protein
MTQLDTKYFTTFFIALMVLCFSSAAQLCQGSLGAPIINKTFGSGSNPGMQLGTSVTNYPFVTNDCPNDGFYTIRNNTSSCFSNSWHSLSGDHTGDANGYFMLVNASVQPGAFYIDTVRGLCSGTTFEFAAWVANVLRTAACGGNGTRPNLTFSIERTDGSVLQQYASGDISSQAAPVWQQHGFFFTTPVGVTDVVLRIVNNAPGGCGNDIALDDITFRPCGPLLTTAITGGGTTTKTICEGTATPFNLSSTISSGYSNPAFQWQVSYNGGAFTDVPGAINSAVNILMPANAPLGSYVYRVVAAEAANMSNVGCRVISSIVTIIVEPKPTTILSANTPICSNSTLQISAASIATQYQWTGPGGFTSIDNPVVIPNAQTTNTGKYYVLASTLAGCSYYDSINVTVNPMPVATVNITAATICEGDTVSLTSSGGNSYIWQPAIGLSNASSAATLAFPAASTNYTAIVSNSFNCTDTALVNITVIKKAQANAGPDVSTIVGVPVRLQATAAGDNITYTWSPPVYLDSPFVLQPWVNAPVGVHNYQLLVSSNAGCGFAPDNVKVTVYDKLYVPTAFTPNNDGKNDKWIIPALAAYPEAEVILYNRYGEMIVKGTKNFTGWDGIYKGQQQLVGAYVYVIKLNDVNNTILKGTVTIIR